MIPYIHYTHCPVCNSDSIGPKLSARDHTVSQENFDIWECGACRLRFTQNVPGPEHIARYYQSEDYISHSDTSRGLINRGYQMVRKRTLRNKKTLVIASTGLKQGRLLDIGSGTGGFAKQMITAGWDVTGLEPDPGARKRAMEINGVELMEAGRLFSFEGGSYDSITLWHVLEHVHELHRYVEQMRFLLKQKGRILIAVPNYTSLDARLYGSHWAAYDVPRHLYHFSPRSLGVLMERHGMKILGHKPMWYDSFYISMLSSRYRNGTTNWIASLFNGLRSNLHAFGDVTRCSSVIYIIGK